MSAAPTSPARYGARGTLSDTIKNLPAERNKRAEHARVHTCQRIAQRLAALEWRRESHLAQAKWYERVR